MFITACNERGNSTKQSVYDIRLTVCLSITVVTCFQIQTGNPPTGGPKLIERLYDNKGSPRLTLT